MTYRRVVAVEFNHCDPAGIVFFPRYYEMLNSLVENFFADELGRSFAAIILDGHCGVPTVRIETDFRHPSRLGERLEFALDVVAVGRSSVDFALRVTGPAGDLRLTSRHRLVWVNDKARAASWPDALRAALTARIEPGETP